MALSFGFAVAALLGAALYAHRNAPPSCTSQDALVRVSAILRDQYHLDSVFMNDVRTVSNGFFGDTYQCSAEVTQIQGNVNASSMPWREVVYRIVYRGRFEPPAITVDLGGAVPLASPEQPFWTRLLAHF